MNHYILPKNNHEFKICPQIQSDIIEPYTSNSLLKSYKSILNDIDSIKQYLGEQFNESFNLINTYEYIFSIIPELHISISKFNIKNAVFYELYEILNCLNIFDCYVNNINAFYICKNPNDLITCHNILRKDNSDFIISSENINNNITDIDIRKYDFIFYEINNSVNDSNDSNELNNYTTQLLQILRIILLHQTNKGNCIIKISHIFYKPIIDILYILCSLFEKVSIIKPSVSNIDTFEKYIVCSKFILSKEKRLLYNNYIISIDLFLSEYNSSQNINSIILDILPCFFINKIDDINIIFGQQQLETIDQMINILKNKNKDEKLDFLKKNNIQKSISWCEKYKMPHNKIQEKPNIFLPLKNDKADELNENLENIIINNK
jgi:hypothetical protein